MKRNIAKLLVYVIFEVIVLLTFYFYSLRSDIFPWGAPDQDGLYWLAYLFYLLPGMLLMGIFKTILYKKNDIIRFSYFVYAGLITIPSSIDLRNIPLMNVGIAICALIAMLNILEYITIIRQQK